MKRIFSYIEPMWTGKDGRVSLRSASALALLVDFVINVHHSAQVVSEVLSLIMKDKKIEPTLVAALAANLAQIAMILGIEAGLIAAMLALKTYQATNIKTDVAPLSDFATTTSEPVATEAA